jgi:hypothetical protein
MIDVARGVLVVGVLGVVVVRVVLVEVVVYVGMGIAVRVQVLAAIRVVLMAGIRVDVVVAWRVGMGLIPVGALGVGVHRDGRHDEDRRRPARLDQRPAAEGRCPLGFTSVGPGASRLPIRGT